MIFGTPIEIHQTIITKKQRIMKRFLVLPIFALIVILSIQLQAQNRVFMMPVNGLATGEATANIVEPLEIVKNIDLTFGNIASGPTFGSVTIATDGSRSGNGGVTLISAGNSNSAANFIITGHPNATFTIDLPLFTEIEYNGEFMTIDNYVSDLGQISMLDGNGLAELNIGATLNVNPNQSSGLYTGSFDVIVAYN